MSRTVPRCDVAVVGAGVAGLIAAWELTRTGRTVVCFEARNRVGGRMLSAAHGEGAVDLGATWFWPQESLVQSLLTHLGIDSFAQSTSGDALFDGQRPVPQRLDGNPIDAPSRRFTHGAQSLPERLAQLLPAGTLRLNDPVHAVRTEDTGVFVEASSGALAAENVVIAVPPALAVEAITFTPQLPAALYEVAARTAVWMGGMVKAVALYDEAFWSAQALSGSAISYRGPFREFHDHSGPGGAHPALFGFAPALQFTGVSRKGVATAFTDQLSRIFGPKAVHPRQILVTDWSREKYTTPADPSLETSTGTYGHPLFQSNTTDRRIHWASTETATAHAGHIEGALRAGLHVAWHLEQTALYVGPTEGATTRRA